MNDMFEWEDQLQNNADIGGDDESETEDEEQDEAALQPANADDFNKESLPFKEIVNFFLGKHGGRS